MKNIVFLVLFIFIACESSKNEEVEINVAEEPGELSLNEVVNTNTNEAVWMPREEMKSRNGNSMGYGAILNPNSSQLVIFLDGGGACFNGLTCNSNLAEYTENDFKERIESEQSLLINRDSDLNQFKDWNFIFIPYATGDVHSSYNSSVDVPNGGPEDQTMVGYNNISIVLNDLKSYFNENNALSEIVFLGSSAGGFGTLTNTLQLHEILADNIPTTVIIDAGPILSDNELLTPCLVNQWETLWNISSFLPNDLNAVVQNSYDYDIQKVYEYLAIKLPEVNFGFLSYYEDNTNRGFYSFGQDDCTYLPTTYVSGEKFKSGILDLKTNVLDDLDNWKVFLAEGTSHTFLSDNDFSQTIGDTSLNDWILDLRQGNALDLTE